MQKKLYKKTYFREGHLYYGSGIAAKPKVDNGKIFFGGKLRKRHRKKTRGHKRKQIRGGLAQIAAQLANKIAGPILNILV